MNYRVLTIISGILVTVLALAHAFSTQRTLGDIQRTFILLFVAFGGVLVSIVGALFFGKQSSISRKKTTLGIIIALFVIFSTGTISYNIISDLVYPIASIDDVVANYEGGGERYYFKFMLHDRYGHITTSDGTVNIKITLDNDILYEKTFTVYKSQFQKSGGWPFGVSLDVYIWDIAASDVPELPSVLEDYAKAGRNVTAIITFTTPQGNTLTGTDDIWRASA